ncbi:nucleotidyltransferase family protein [Methylohalobius crimeensis]|uniref:nucleotidyltransferase family protein n=1 Tax=Methylohalobius crimeensis TaxID=244365 RepID=UPI0003B5A908|nr:nucleotidyltransferase family protein [Methylohalobius crimeensis]
MTTPRLFDAVLLAADREGENPVARAAGAPCKTLTPIGGQSLLSRVLDALEHCPTVQRCILCGPSEPIMSEPSISSVLELPWLEWIAPQPSPSLSALAGLAHIPENRPALLTTADLAFPDPRVFEDFCRGAATLGGDVAVGLIPYQTVAARYPGVRRTSLKFTDGPFCTCNLFAFLTPKGRTMVEFWRNLERERKHPWRLVRALDMIALIRYLLGRLSTQAISQRIEKKMGIQVNFVVLPYPDAAIDVDTEDDLHLVRAAVGDD